MKQALITAALLITALTACRKEKNKSVIVVKDCTGVYLRFDGKDYHVCNPERVGGYADGATVTATFQKITDCNGSAKDAVVCTMVHANEGWIEVIKVK